MMIVQRNGAPLDTVQCTATQWTNRIYTMLVRASYAEQRGGRGARQVKARTGPSGILSTAATTAQSRLLDGVSHGGLHA